MVIFGTKCTVHNVNVNIFRTGIGGNFNIACKICKICGAE